MKYAKQKQIKEETDSLFPKKRNDGDYNIIRCKYNALRLSGDSMEEALKKLGH